MKIFKKYWIAVFISLIYFLLLSFTLKDYGMHEDSPFHFLRGQAYLQKILTGEPQFNIPNLKSPVLFSANQRISLYKPNASEELMAPIRSVGIIQDNEPTLKQEFLQFLKTQGKRESFYKHNAWTANYWDTIFYTHPAVSDIFMALSNRIFYERLGILSDIAAYHIYVIFSVSLALFFIFIFCQEVFGLKTALFTAISFIFFPYLFAESHFNIKDPVQMSYYTIAVISFYFWVTQKLSLKWFVPLVLSIFVAIGTKWNIVFLPIILIPWLLIIKNIDEIKPYLNKKNILIYGSLMIVVPIILLIIFWPFLWTDAYSKLLDTLYFYSELAVKDSRVETVSFAPLFFGLDARALIRIFSNTPPATILFWIIGMIGIVFKKIKTRFKAEWLIVIWMIVPLLRVIWSDSTLNGSIRNIIEYFPAFVIISGIGANFLLAKVNTKFIKIITFITVITYIAFLSFNIFKFHPNENIYFNFLVGGLPGAQKKEIYRWETIYDNDYKQGVDWLNKNAPSKAKIAYLDGTLISISPLWMRDDIRMGTYFSGFEQKGEYIISTIYTVPPQVFPYLYVERFLIPVYELKVEGVSILKIWKNEKKYLNPKYKKEIEFKNQINVTRYTKENKKIWEIIFDKSILLTRINLKYENKNCIDKNVVWSVVNQEKEDFLVPDKTNLNPGETEFYFPAEKVEKLRFWDVAGGSCLYEASVDKIFYLGD